MRNDWHWIIGVRFRSICYLFMNQKKSQRNNRTVRRISWVGLAFALSLSATHMAYAQPVDATGALKPIPGYGEPKQRAVPPGYGQPRQLAPLPGYGQPHRKATGQISGTLPPASTVQLDTPRKRYYRPIPITPQPDTAPQTGYAASQPLKPQAPTATQIPFGQPSKPLQAQEKPAKDGWIALPPARPREPEPVYAQPQQPAPQPQPQLQPARIKPVEPQVSAPPAIMAEKTPEPEIEAATLDQTEAQFNDLIMPLTPPQVAEAEVAIPAETAIAQFEAILQSAQSEAAEMEEGVQAKDKEVPFKEDEAAIETVPVEPVIVADLPILSEASRKILDKTPSGIDMPKKISTPDPVIIKREDPNAGLIPMVDYRAHEEMGLTIEVRKASFNVHHYLEKAYDNLIAQKYDIAAGYYNEVLNVEPKNEMALFGLATTYHKNGQLDAARDIYGRLLEIDPTHREGLNNFMALLSDEAPLDALGELQELEKNSPDFSPIPAQIGIIYTKLGDYPKAVNKLSQALLLSPENLSYKYALAVALDKMGEKQKAADLYIELIEDYRNGATLPGDIEQIKNRAIFLSRS